MQLRRAGMVFLGGGLGACGRALAIQLLAPLSSSIPFGVLVVNLTGAFILGAVWILADEMELLRQDTRLFLAVGLLGGFTTFSTFGWGADLLLSGNKHADAVIYIVASVAGGVAAVAAGLVAGREGIELLERGARRLLLRLDGRRRGQSSAIQELAAIEAENREDTA